MKKWNITYLDLATIHFPLAIAFAATGLEGWHVGPVYIRPSEILLLLALPRSVALFLKHPSLLRDPLLRAEVIVWSTFLFWLATCLFLKGLPVGDLRQVRLVVFRAVVMFVITTSFGNTARRYSALFLAMAAGCLISAMRYFFLVGWPTCISVRPLPNIYLATTIGYRYIWLSTCGAVLWAGALLLPASTRWLSLLRRATGLLGLVAVLVSGTRAIIYSLPILFLVRLSSKTHVLLLSVRIIAIVAISAGFLFGLLPTVARDVVPYYAHLRMLGPEDGTARLVDSKTVRSGIEVRLIDWMALSKQNFSQKFFGEPYDHAMTRAHSLGHPHNIYLLLAILAGWPAALLFAAGLWVFLLRITGAVNQRSTTIGTHVAISCLFLLVCLLFILPTNSAVLGIPVIFGFLLACPTHRLSSPENASPKTTEFVA